MPCVPLLSLLIGQYPAFVASAGGGSGEKGGAGDSFGAVGGVFFIPS